MLAIQTEVSDGTLETINVGILYLERTDISVFLSTAPSTELVDGVDYEWTSDTSIEFLTGPVANGVTVRLIRTTDNEAMLNIYDGGGPFSRATLDENFNQLLFLTQEFTEGVNLGNLETNLDMNGNLITELGDGVLSTDAVNKGQLDAAIAKTLRTPDDIPALGNAAARANKYLTFDLLGNPTLAVSAADSASVLKTELANDVNPILGQAMIGRGLQVVLDLDALRLLDKTAPSKYAFVLSHDGVFGAGGGVYRFDSTDLVGVDNDATLIVAADGGRWHLVHGGSIDVRTFGAIANDSTDAFAAIQAAINYAVANDVGTVHIPGRYMITDTLVVDTGTFTQGISLVGDGVDTSRIRQTGVGKDVIWWSTTQFLRCSSIKDIELLALASAGHGVNVKYGCTLNKFENVNVTVLNPSKSLYYANWAGLLVTDPHGIYDTIWEGGDLYCSATHSVNPIDIITRGTTFNENTMRNMRWNGNNAPISFCRITNVDNATWLTNCLIQNINFELCKFGGIVVTNVRGWGFRGFSFWDTGSPYQNHLLYFAANAGLDSVDNTIERIARHGDSLAAGVREIYTEDAQDTTCINVSPIVGSSYDWNNKRVRVIGQSLRSFSLNLAGYRDDTNWSSAGGTFASTTGAGMDDHGVTSIVRNSAGIYTVTLSQAQSNANYQIALSWEFTGAPFTIAFDTQTTTTFRILTFNAGGGSADPGGKITFTVFD